MKISRIGRIEDFRLLTGQGQFGDDRRLDGCLYAAFARADLASADVLSLDCEAARNMPGVVAVLTAQDLAAHGVGPVQLAMQLTGPDGREWVATPRPLLASDRVRYVGEPLAIVIADTRLAALDAAEAVEIDLSERPALTSLAEAMATDAPLVHDDRPRNLALQWARGDWEAAGAAIAGSRHQIRLETPVTRVTAVAMEPRNAIAGPIEGGRMQMICSHNNPVAMHGALAAAFGMEKDQIRCHSGDVGGSFGMKSGPLREEFTVFWAARHLDRTIRWTADRNESFLTDEAARDVHLTSELGLDDEGNFTAMRFHLALNVGAYASTRSVITMANFGGMAGVYKTPMIAGQLEAFLTHTVPTAPYRGAGRPEATLAVEALIDRAAAECGFDRVALRRRNLIPKSAMPWKSPFIFNYDCGDFERMLDAALVRSDWSGFAARQANARARGLVRGRGLAMCIETAGGMYASPGRDFSNVEIHGDGRITIAMGTFSAGSGIETVMTDIAARAFQIAPDRVTYRQGDTDLMDRGRGMGGSAAMPQGSAALADGVEKALAQARSVAVDLLEADTHDIDYADGAFRVAGTDRVVTLTQVAETAAAKGLRLLGEGSFAPESSTFPNGCHVCEVEIDPETGQCTIASYTGVEDIGTVINPQLAEGQIHGGVVQGLGQMLCEEIRYSDGDGQMLSASFMDYAMPRADAMPMFACAFEAVPTRVNPTGVKGVGEAGTVGALAAGMSAIGDAMRQLGVDRFDMPASPTRVWSAIQGAIQPE